MLNKFPEEIRERIFLWLNHKDLERTRCYQSKYIKEITKYKSIREAKKNNNLKNENWLRSRGQTDEHIICIFPFRSRRRGKAQMMLELLYLS